MVLVQKEPKAIKIGSTAVKKVMLGSTQIRPAGWQPDPSRTIFYYDFQDSNNRLADTSGNNNNATSASNISYVEVGGQYVAQTTNTNNGIAIPGSYGTGIGNGDFTMSCWFYPINVGSGRYSQIFSVNYMGGNVGNSIIWFDPNNILSDSTPSGAGVKWMLGDAAYHKGTISPTTLYNGWHHFVMTRNNGVITCYIDTNIDISWNSSNAFSSSGTGCLVGRTGGLQSFPSGAKGDKFILEKVGWSANDVQTYYNQTKSLYGIS